MEDIREIVTNQWENFKKDEKKIRKFINNLSEERYNFIGKKENRGKSFYINDHFEIQSELLETIILYSPTSIVYIRNPYPLLVKIYVYAMLDSHNHEDNVRSFYSNFVEEDNEIVENTIKHYKLFGGK